MFRMTRRPAAISDHNHSASDKDKPRRQKNGSARYRATFSAKSADYMRPSWFMAKRSDVPYVPKRTPRSGTKSGSPRRAIRHRHRNGKVLAFLQAPLLKA